MRMRAATTALIAAAALGVAACGSDGGGVDQIEQSVKEQEKLAAQAATTTTTATTTTPAAPGPSIQKLDISTDLKKKPEIARPSGEPPSELYQRDIVTGKGKAAKSGDNVTVQYVGVKFSDGEQFDASWDNGKPFPFQLGQGAVIKGWDEGVAGMKAGGRRLLVIPPDKAYGAQGQGDIGPNETLMFVVDLEKIGS
jgi:peptidylprolyl isomerase